MLPKTPEEREEILWQEIGPFERGPVADAIRNAITQAKAEQREVDAKLVDALTSEMMIGWWHIKKLSQTIREQKP